MDTVTAGVSLWSKSSVRVADGHCDRGCVPEDAPTLSAHPQVSRRGTRPGPSRAVAAGPFDLTQRMQIRAQKALVRLEGFSAARSREGLR